MSVTRWRCDKCGRDGCVGHDEHEGVLEVVRLIGDSHNAASPTCSFSVGSVRILSSRGTEARRFVKKLFEVT